MIVWVLACGKPEAECAPGFGRAADGNCYPLQVGTGGDDADGDADSDADSDSDIDADTDGNTGVGTGGTGAVGVTGDTGPLPDPTLDFWGDYDYVSPGDYVDLDVQVINGLGSQTSSSFVDFFWYINSSTGSLELEPQNFTMFYAIWDTQSNTDTVDDYWACVAAPLSPSSIPYADVPASPGQDGLVCALTTAGRIVTMYLSQKNTSYITFSYYAW